MNNPYIRHFENQAGDGIANTYGGYQYQRGHGFSSAFSSLFQNILKPLGIYLGKRALSTGMDIGGDVMSGQNFASSAKKRLKSAGNQIISDAADRAKTFAQTGKGRRRRRRKTKKINKKVIVKKSKPQKRKRRRSKKKSTKRRRTKKKSALSHLF